MSRKSWLMMILSMTQTEGIGARSHWSTINELQIQFTAWAVVTSLSSFQVHEATFHVINQKETCYCIPRVETWHFQQYCL